MLPRTSRAAHSPLLKPLARRSVAWGLAVSLLCPPMGGLLSAAQAQAPNGPATNPTRNGPALPPPLPVVEPAYGASSILLFPFTNNANSPAAEGLAGQIVDALKLRLGLVGSYQVTSYSKFLAPVQRAVDDNVLQQSDLAGPFDARKAGRIAAQVQTDDYLTGAIESVTVDPATRHVSIEVSADLRSSRTGNSLRTLAFTGTGIPVTNSDTLDSVTQRAVNAAASRLSSAIYPGRAMARPEASSSRGHGKGGQVFLVSLLTGALLFAILHNSSNNGGSGGGSTTTGGTGTGGGGATVPPVPQPPGIGQ